MLNLPKEFKSLVSADARVKYYSNNYIKQILLKRFFEKVFKLVEAVNPASAVEIGCGDGLSGYLFKRRFPVIEYLAADQDRSVLSAAARVLGPDLLMLDGLELPFPENSFDLALYLEVFEHAGKWEKVLEEGIRISKKALIFSVPAFPWYQLSNLVAGKNILRLGEHPGHIHKFRRKNLESALTQLIKQKAAIAQKAKSIEIVPSFPWIISKINLAK